MKHDLTMPEILYALRQCFWTSRKLHAFNTFALHQLLESDFVAVTKAGRIHEVEIKMSRGDFKNDFKKMVTPNNALKRSYGGITVMPGNKHELMQQGLLANHFYFAVPKGLILPEEVPEYTGLIYLERTNVRIGWEDDRELRVWASLVKKAPLLHPNKITPEKKEALLLSMLTKAWNGSEAKWRKGLSA